MHHHRHPHHPSDPPHVPWTVLLLLSVAQFMVVLDVTVVNVALPSIGDALGFAPADLQWVVTAYVLFTGGALLLGGRLADMLGRRRVFLAGLLVFTGASLASALAPSPTALIVARSAQGLGAALLTPAALSIVTATYTGAQRKTALTTWGAIASAGAAAGMLFGGMLTSWASWEWVFLINVPIGVALALGTLHVVAPSRPVERGRRFDIPGAALALGGFVTLVYALDGAAEHGWGSTRTLGLLAVAAALLATFAAVERRVAKPLVHPSTWRSRPLTGGAVLMLGGTALLVGGFFLNTLYLQTVLDASALETGLSFLPIAVAIGVSAHLAGHLLDHLGTRGVALAGLGLMVASAALLATVPGDASYAADLLPGFVLLGLGVGLVLPAANVTAMSDVSDSDAGLASGLMATAHEVGAALGVALLSAIALGAGGATGGAAFVEGYQDAFVAGAVIAAALAAGVVAALPSVRPAAGAHVALH